MEPEVQVSRQQTRKINITALILLILMSVIILAISVFAYITLQNRNTYSGVYIGNHDVSGMSRQEIVQLLESRYSIPARDVVITLKSPLTELKASFPELGVVYDVEAAADAAYSHGRRGNPFIRLYDIAVAAFRGVIYNVQQTYDENRIDYFVDRFSVNAFQSVKEGALLVTDDRVIIRSGRHGESIDKAEAKSLITGMIKAGKGGVAEPEVTISSPTRFNADEIYAQIKREPVEAIYKRENDELVLVPHVTARQLDIEQLKRIIDDQNKTEDTERLLPVSFINPEITADKAASMLFRDELANFTTHFETRTQSEKNRMHNISLAISKINDQVLMPGEEFSFNQVVGPRNGKYGYKEAHVFINGRVEDGMGGGICQAVSTLYNAVLMSDLEVLERKNHSFIVTYVPLGQDATAYYGGTDFRFVNTTGWPLKIIAAVEDNDVKILFQGTNTTPEKTVIISNKTLSNTKYTTKYVDDPKLPTGTVKKSQYGTDGFVVETYKTVKIGDDVLSQNKLHTSRYKPCDEEFLVGILNPDGTTTPGLAAQMTQQQTQTPPVTTQPSETPETPANQTPAQNDTPEAPTDQRTPADPQIPDDPGPDDADTDPAEDVTAADGADTSATQADTLPEAQNGDMPENGGTVEDDDTTGADTPSGNYEIIDD